MVFTRQAEFRSGSATTHPGSELLQQRVRTLGVAAFAIGFVAWVCRFVLGVAMDQPFGGSMVWHLVGAAPFLVLWWWLRGPLRSTRVIYACEMAALLASTTAYCLMGASIPLHATPELIVSHALTYGYLGRAAFVPGTARRSVVVTSLALLPQVVVWTIVYNGVEPTSWVLLEHGEFARQAWTVIWWMLTVLLAWFIARTTHELRRDAEDARKLGKYTLGEKLGEGGMGEVYRATHARLRRPTAVKLLRADRAGATSAERFEREAQATAQLTSPHTVDLYDFGQAEDGTIYYVMELLEGIDLRRYVESFGPAPEERVVHWLLQACHSLGEAHANGLIHRDIKPANLHVGRQGRDVDVLKILDFGLVKNQARPASGPDDLQLTQDGAISGTPAYLAPEQLLGAVPVDARTDLYGLGCVAFWVLTGRDVFEETNPTRMMMAHLSSPAPAPSSVTENPVAAELDALVLACLAKRPEERPRDADDLAARLRALTLETPWDTARAARWWSKHMPGADASLGTAPESRV